MPEWLQNPVVYWGLAIGAMFFGYFFGLFEGRGQGYKRRKAEEAEKEESEPASEPLPPANPPTPSDEVPVLDVSMDIAGQLRLKLDGQNIDASAMDAEQRKRIIAVLTQMRPWLEPSKSASSPPQPRSGREPIGAIRPASSPQGGSSPQGAPSPSPKPSPELTVGERPTAPPVDDKEKEPVPEPQSIVGQIDSILQSQMTGTPLMEKGIRLMESPEGGVFVWVGIDKYESVDEVPDEQIKAAIRAAIGAWESKFTPGH